MSIEAVLIGFIMCLFSGVVTGMLWRTFLLRR